MTVELIGGHGSHFYKASLNGQTKENKTIKRRKNGRKRESKQRKKTKRGKKKKRREEGEAETKSIDAMSRTTKYYRTGLALTVKDPFSSSNVPDGRGRRRPAWAICEPSKASTRHHRLLHLPPSFSLFLFSPFFFPFLLARLVPYLLLFVGTSLSLSLSGRHHSCSSIVSLRR